MCENFSVRTLVLFDGSNFYHRVKSLGLGISLSTFLYRKFVDSIIGAENIVIRYHVGEVKRAGGRELKPYQTQLRFIEHLRKQGIEVVLGYLLLVNGKYHEKGVDVNLALDIAVGALKDEYDTCYLISSDTDLIPAINLAQESGKIVIYVGFQHRYSEALKRVCKRYLLLGGDDVRKFSAT